MKGTCPRPLDDGSTKTYVIATRLKKTRQIVNSFMKAVLFDKRVDVQVCALYYIVGQKQVHSPR